MWEWKEMIETGMTKEKGIQQEFFDESFYKGPEDKKKEPSKKKLNPKGKKSSNISRQQSVFMIEGLLKVAKNWPEEVKFASILIKKHGWDFWKTFKPEFLVNTLRFYFSKKGEQILKLRKIEKKRKFLLNEKKETFVDPDSPKLGEDLKIQKTPKTIKDFLS